MTHIKKIIDKQGNDIYLRTHTKAVVDDNGYTTESRLQAMQDEINQKQLEVGAVPSDLTPTEGSSNWVTSGGVYNVLGTITGMLGEEVTHSIIDSAISTNVTMDWDNNPPVKWRNYGRNDLKGAIINVSRYQGKSISIQANTSNSSQIVFCASVPVAGESINFATGYSKHITISANTVLEATVPQDCTCLWYIVLDNGTAKGISDVVVTVGFGITEQVAMNTTTLSGISDSVYGTERQVDLSEQTIYPNLIASSTKKWAWTTDTYSMGCVLFPVTVGMKYKITANLSYDTAYAFLRTNVIVNDASADFASGCDINSVNKGKSVTVEAPKDAGYIYIAVEENGANKMPSDFIEIGEGGAIPALKAIESKLDSYYEIFVAASDAPASDKSMADFVCNGTNDEIVLQNAINTATSRGAAKIALSKGTFYIDSFPNVVANDGNSHVALLLPNDGITRDFDISGISYSDTQIIVSDSCYEGLDDNTQYKIISANYVASLFAANAKTGLTLSNLSIRIPWNQKKVMCLDLEYIQRARIEYIKCAGYISGYSGGWEVAIRTPPAVAVQGCVGIQMTGGSNAGTINNYTSITCSGFYEGFKVGGEHVVMINCSGIFNVYSYTFGNYALSNGFFFHPITMINCCDERTVNLPLFVDNGYPNNSSLSRKGQTVDMIGFNVERYAAATPGGVLGNPATESTPGIWHGKIDYSIYTESNPTMSVTMPFWADGSGREFESRNNIQKLSTTKGVLQTYAPNYLQRCFVTDLAVPRELICVDPAIKKWVDYSGNECYNTSDGWLVS